MNERGSRMISKVWLARGERTTVFLIIFIPVYRIYKVISSVREPPDEVFVHVLVDEEHDGAPGPQPHDLGHQPLVEGSEPGHVC